MDILKNLNDAVKYVESNLCAEFEFNKVAEIACTSTDGFQRIFSYLTGISVSEYIRRRRLTQASYELQSGNLKIIDLAVKYGYDSADSFSRAFIKQHGITPTQARRVGVTLKSYPPVSFHIMIKGMSGMNYKIVEKAEFTVTGISQHFEGVAEERWNQEHDMWVSERERVSETVPGIWFGIWNNGEYIIAKKAEDDCKENLQEFTIPAAKYAVFETGYGDYAGVLLPELRNRIFHEWLPDSDYKIKKDYEVEVYHLFSKTERHKRHYEIWIPIQ